MPLLSKQPDDLRSRLCVCIRNKQHRVLKERLIFIVLELELE